MTDEKIREVLDSYEEYTGGEYWSATEWRHEMAHLHQMIPQMRVFLTDGRREKVMRWLGFMQGAFWAIGVFTIEDLMAHNKPEDEEFDESK